MGIQWTACDHMTGNVIAELPGLQLKSTLSRYIAKGAGTQLSLPLLDRLPVNWKLATEPWKTVLVATYDNPDQTILWAGIVEKREWGSDTSVSLSVVPVESWLERQYVAGAWTNTEQTTIARGVGLDKVAQYFHGQVIETPTGVTRSRTITADDDKTALAELQAMVRVTSGIEWTIDWKWDQGRLVALPTVASRIGRPAPVDRPPSFVIARAEWTRTTDFTQQYGANTVVGSMIREGDVRRSVVMHDTALVDTYGYLPAEYRWQPDTSATSTATLTPWVIARLQDMRLGADILELSLHVDDMVIGSPQVGLGDDVLVELTNDACPEISESSIQRIVGWSLDIDATTSEPTKFTPVFIPPTDFGGGDVV